ncbi:MAG: hypothetical protein Q4C54_02135 [Clostridia bacterium]|nr:hypothetical protein [Clostridia bacterium]
MKSIMENNIISMDQNAVENRRLTLENAMVDRWSSVLGESSSVAEHLQQVLKDNGADIDDFIASDEMQQQLLEAIFPEMVLALQNNTTSGLFLVLDNGKDMMQPAKYNGFFLRDSDPTNKISSNTDILLERGSKRLARQQNIPMDSPWATRFKLEGFGYRKADDFFYQPLKAAKENPGVEPRILGYWSPAFILEDHYLDTHQMITYSVPLVYQGRVYGVMGVEVSTRYLATYVPVRDLDQGLNAGYAIAVSKGDGVYEVVMGTGSLYKSVVGNSSAFRVTGERKEHLYELENGVVGEQSVYALISPMKLYSNNVPYEGTEWALVGFVTENSVFAPGNLVYGRILTTILVCSAVGLLMIILLVRKVTRPVNRLMESVRRGYKGLKEYEPSSVR